MSWECYTGLLCARQPTAFHLERQEMLYSVGLGKLFWLPHVAEWPKNIWNYFVKERVHTFLKGFMGYFPYSWNF